MNTKATEINSTMSAQQNGVPFPESKFKQDMAEAEQEFYRCKLAKPLLEVIRPDTDLRKAYELQQEVLSNWIVSQPAFKELARKHAGPANDKSTLSKERLK